MQGHLVILTGASASGKTTLAHTVQQAPDLECEVFFFDSIGVPSPAAMAAWGEGHQPGGAWQRSMTLAWFTCIASTLAAGKSVLFEGQMRIAFIMEAIQTFGLTNARVLLIDCDDAVRKERLHQHRRQPELADAQMMAWARYLREEASQWHCEAIDTGAQPYARCVAKLLNYLRCGASLEEHDLKPQLSSNCG